MRLHRIETVERGDGYAARCTDCEAITFGGFGTEEEAHAACVRACARLVGPRPSQAAIEKAGMTLAVADIADEQMSPRELAEQCFTPTGPPVDELEDRIRAKRGLPPLDRGEEGDAGT